MGSYDEVPDVIFPYDSQLKVWEGGKDYKQNDLVPAVGMADTYAVRLNARGESPPPRFLTVQENRITNLMAHQPIPGASVFDKWGKYLGRGGGPLEEPGPSDEQAISLVEQAMQGVSPAILEEIEEPARTFLEPPSPQEDEVECHLHRFWLREDLEVEVKLPLDLTDEEAERFAGFVTTLPLSAKRF